MITETGKYDGMNGNDPGLPLLGSSPKLYKRRWGLLLAVFVLQFFGGISYGSYGQISDFYVSFFRVSHTQEDWITNARNISAIFITAPLAWLIFRGSVRLRGLTLIVAVTSTVGLALVTLAHADRRLMALIVLGQVFCGMAETVGVALPSTMAVLWFPENQVGTAIALNVLGMYLGNGVGNVVPAHLIYSNTSVNAVTLDDVTLQTGSTSLMTMYGGFLAVSAGACLFLFFFMTDRPPSAPTRAQKIKSGAVEDLSDRSFLRESLLLLKNRSYVFSVLALGLVFQMVLLDNMMMPEIIGHARITTSSLSNVRSDVLSGYVVSLYSLGGIVGLLVSGRVVDMCKKYKELALGTMSAVLVSTVGLTLGVVFNINWLLFTSTAFFGLFSATVEIVLMEIVTQQTYPVDESLVNTWLTGVQTVIGLCLGVTGRLMYQSFGRYGVLIFQSVGIAISIVLIAFTSGRNRRLEVENRLEGYSEI